MANNIPAHIFPNWVLPVVHYSVGRKVKLSCSERAYCNPLLCTLDHVPLVAAAGYAAHKEAISCDVQTFHSQRRNTFDRHTAA
jgi:hypothetical protein